MKNIKVGEYYLGLHSSCVYLVVTMTSDYCDMLRYQPKLTVPYRLLTTNSFEGFNKICILKARALIKRLRNLK